MLDAVLDALIDTAKLLPILFFTYLLMEYLEHHAGSKLALALNRWQKAGPLLGAGLGLIPQCGFSGAVASLYAGGAVTMGTLLAVFLATSDEMLPILISAQIPASTMALILGVKLAAGCLVGYLVDLLHRNRQTRHIHDLCEAAHCSCEDGILRSALRHTLQIILLILAVNLALNLLFSVLPRETIGAAWRIPVLGELAAGVLGLLPNCAASVMITQFYVQGVMPAGPMLAGLMVNAGVGLLILFRVNQSRKESLKIAGILLSSGVILGLVLGVALRGVL